MAHDIFICIYYLPWTTGSCRAGKLIVLQLITDIGAIEVN